jgi:PPM family protein phosphatase
VTNPLTKLISSLRGDAPPNNEASKEVPTIPIPTEKVPVPATVAAPPPPVLTLETPQFLSACAQSVGKQREHNEDSVFLINTLLSSNGENIPMGLFIVADGMGGHKHGEIASGLAVRSIANTALRKIFLSMVAVKPSPPQDSIQEILESSVQEAHKVIMKEAPGSGTTLTAVLLLEKHMSIAHVGDSRAYLLNNEGHLLTLTRDHSLVMRMMELGQLTVEEAAIHPQRNVLYKALGQGEPFVPDITSSPLPEAGQLLLCSDGLWGVVPEEEMARILTTTPNPQVACQMLVDAANQAGGPDNISAVLIRLP